MNILSFTGGIRQHNPGIKRDSGGRFFCLIDEAGGEEWEVRSGMQGWRLKARLLFLRSLF